MTTKIKKAKTETTARTDAKEDATPEASKEADWENIESEFNYARSFIPEFRLAYREELEALKLDILIPGREETELPPNVLPIFDAGLINQYIQILWRLGMFPFDEVPEFAAQREEIGPSPIEIVEDAIQRRDFSDRFLFAYGDFYSALELLIDQLILRYDQTITAGIKKAVHGQKNSLLAHKFWCAHWLAARTTNQSKTTRDNALEELRFSCAKIASDMVDPPFPFDQGWFVKMLKPIKTCSDHKFDEPTDAWELHPCFFEISRPEIDRMISFPFLSADELPPTDPTAY